MLREVFGANDVSLTVYGNVLSATAMLYGMSSADLRRDELAATDPEYPVIIGAVASR
jgi:hypothetical protein